MGAHVVGAEAVALFNVAARKDPVLRAVHGEGTRAIHQLPVAAVVPAPEEAHARQLVLRPADEVVAPERRDHLGLGRREFRAGAEALAGAGALMSRVHVVPLLPAGEGPALVLRPRLPAAGVPGEERDVATLGDPGFQAVAHTGGPVLVVADGEHELVALEELRVVLQVGVHRVVQGVACARKRQRRVQGGREQRRGGAVTGGSENKKFGW